MKQVNVILVEIAQLHHLTYRLNNTGFKRYNTITNNRNILHFPLNMKYIIIVQG